MPDMETAAARLIKLARSQGLIRPRDLEPLGIPRISLTRAVSRGELERVGRGLYGLPDRPISAHGTLPEVALWVPKGVVCLLSALRFHGLTTQAPFEIWLAIENKALAPKLDYPPLRIVRFSGKAWTAGVETHVVDGGPRPCHQRCQGPLPIASSTGTRSGWMWRSRRCARLGATNA